MDQEPKPKTRKQRLEELLMLIAGCEESIRMSMESGGDRKFEDAIRAKKVECYQKLKRVVYGLPEERKLPTEE